MGRIVDAVLSPLVFNRYPVSILAALLYGLVFASVLFSDSLPRVKYSKDFDRAVTDLTRVRREVLVWVIGTYAWVADYGPPPPLSIARERSRKVLFVVEDQIHRLGH